MDKELALRLVEALESIKTNLETISSSLSDASVSLDSLDRTLAGCTYTGQTGSFMRVTGSISTN